MRLLRADTLELVEFYDAQIPPYAILSHTWAREEVTYQDMLNHAFRHKAGFEKIEKCCAMAVGSGIAYAWVDTCCIDKKSSAELSEAINSMYRWYKKAQICYAFLEDVSHDGCDQPNAFDGCRWFTRGFTLQELIAPREVLFYDRCWEFIGTRASLLTPIYNATGIAKDVLQGKADIANYSVAARMSWAAHRETSRVEDVAYCLLGLFEINMPLLYGESSRAFQRLQEEIMKRSYDYSLFVWRMQDTDVFRCYREAADLCIDPKDSFCTPMALHPSCFAGQGDVRRAVISYSTGLLGSAFSFGNRGLLMQAHVLPVSEHNGQAYGSCCVALFPVLSGALNGCEIYLGIYLHPLPVEGHYVRAFPNLLYSIGYPEIRLNDRLETVPILLSTTLPTHLQMRVTSLNKVVYRPLSSGYETGYVKAAAPPHSVSHPEAFFFSNHTPGLLGAILLEIESSYNMALLFASDSRGVIFHSLRRFPTLPVTLAHKGDEWYRFVRIAFSAAKAGDSTVGEAGWSPLFPRWHHSIQFPSDFCVCFPVVTGDGTRYNLRLSDQEPPHLPITLWRYPHLAMGFFEAMLAIEWEQKLPDARDYIVGSGFGSVSRDWEPYAQRVMSYV